MACNGEYTMIEVKLGATLRSAAGNRDTFHVEATNVRQLLRYLEETYPELRPVLERGVAVAIDGQMSGNDWLRPVSPESEVFLMPRVAGG